MAKKKVLRLKPGDHQFVAGAAHFHNNENTSAKELEWYVKHYPHIKNMLEEEKPETDGLTIND